MFGIKTKKRLQAERDELIQVLRQVMTSAERTTKDGYPGGYVGQAIRLRVAETLNRLDK